MRKRELGLGLEVKLIEPKVNYEASEFVGKNFTKIIGYIYKLGISNKANDLLQDVVVSLLNQEVDGEGYNNGYFDGKYISVEQFVYSRIKLYAKNVKYRDDVVESGSSVNMSVRTEYVEKIGSNGQAVKDNQGNKVYTKIKTVEKNRVSCNTYSATCEVGGEDIGERNDSFQKAYAEACVADETDDIDDKLSIREHIDICIDICSLYSINIVNILKNIEQIGNILSSSKSSKINVIFNKLKDAVEYNNELEEALISVLNFSSKHSNEFKEIIAEY